MVVLGMSGAKFFSDPISMSDDDALRTIKELEELAEQSSKLARQLKDMLLQRMLDAGATLRLSPVAKLRIYNESKLRSKDAVADLYHVCPDTLKEKCFALEYIPRKRGLDELAKLGTEWQSKVKALYEVKPTLRIEWSKV